jgi:hypothetical protein
LADVAVGAPLNATIEIAGPEKMSIAEFVGRFMAASGDRTRRPCITGRRWAAPGSHRVITRVSARRGPRSGSSAARLGGD